MAIVVAIPRDEFERVVARARESVNHRCVSSRRSSVFRSCAIRARWLSQMMIIDAPPTDRIESISYATLSPRAPPRRCWVTINAGDMVRCTMTHGIAKISRRSTAADHAASVEHPDAVRDYRSRPANL